MINRGDDACGRRSFPPGATLHIDDARVCITFQASGYFLYQRQRVICMCNRNGLRNKLIFGGFMHPGKVQY